MNIPELNPKKYKIHKGLMMMEGTFSGNERIAIGVDPGINFGLTIISGESVKVYWGRLDVTKEQASKPGLKGVAAYNYVKSNVPSLSLPFSFTAEAVTYYDYQNPKAVIEGAAYGRPHRQVELEEERFGFYLALRHMGFDVVIMPPASIRLKAFGNGKLSAVDVYPSLNQNAVDSVGCALAAISRYDGNNS